MSSSRWQYWINLSQLPYTLLRYAYRRILHLLYSTREIKPILDSRYTYMPLLPSDHVRYLAVAPSTNINQPLVGTLESAALDDLPAYEAVSYVWGSNQRTSQIYIDGKDIPITANLDAALRHLRLPNTTRILWVDSVCIDQQNRKERGNQVALMGQIYAKASKTRIHLGADPEGHAEKLASLLSEIMVRINAQKVDLSNHVSLPELDPSDPLSGDERWESYKALLGCQWCSRVWTVQEAALGGKPTILWGDTEIPWSQLVGVNLWLLTKARHVWYYMKPWLNDVHMPAFWQPASPFRLIELLVRAKPLQCSDSRDRVYAFFGSSTARLGLDGGLIMLPDYEKDFRVVYLEFARAWLTRTHDLGLLSAVEHTKDTFEDELPSWVPRWDVSLTNNCFGLYEQGFDASKGLERSRLDIVGRSKLQLKGMIFDTVLWTSAVLPEHMGLEQPRTGLLQMLWNYLSNTKSEANELVAAWNHVSSTSMPFSYKHGSRLLSFVRTLCRHAYQDAPEDDFHPDEAAFALRLRQQSSHANDDEASRLKKLSKSGDIKAFASHAGIWAALRRLILTENGNYALAPQITEVGDLCAIISGMEVPAILRKIDGENRYRLVGEAFVLGKMNGEVAGAVGRHQWALKDISLS